MNSKIQNLKSSKLREAPRTPRKRATSAKICDAARRLFFEHGFDGTTIEQIAAAAGTRRSTLYTHFQDKDEILQALIEEYLIEVQAHIDLLPSPSPSRAEIDQWVRSFAELATNEQVPTVLLMQSGSTIQAPESVRRFGRAMIVRLAERIPAFRQSMGSSLGVARAQAVLRQLGSSLAHHVQNPESGNEQLTVAAEWLDWFINRSEQGAVAGR